MKQYPTVRKFFFVSVFQPSDIRVGMVTLLLKRFSQIARLRSSVSHRESLDLSIYRLSPWRWERGMTVQCKDEPTSIASDPELPTPMQVFCTKYSLCRGLIIACHWTESSDWWSTPYLPRLYLHSSSLFWRRKEYYSHCHVFLMRTYVE